MKSPYVGTLVPNETVTACFLVLTKDIRRRRTGEVYLSLQLADRTGDIEAKMWDNVPEIMDTFDRDDFVKVRGLVQVYQNRSQLTIHKLRRLEEHEVEPSDFFPCSERDPDEMFRELQGIIAGISNPHLHALLRNLFDNPSIVQRYKIAPAAKNIHHACRGGLLEHVLSLCHLCKTVGPHYRNVDIDLLLTGAILHDIGKLDELSYERSFGYSADGQLLGHIIIGLRMAGDVMAKLPGFPPKLRTLVEHLIISHHGELEFGSPKMPLFQEALLLHHLDNLDSKMETLHNALKRDAQLDGDFTAWVGPLERSLLRKDRYLDEEKGTGVHAASVTAVAPLQPAAPSPAVPQTPPQSPAPGAKPASVPTNPAPPSTLFGQKLQAVLDSSK